MPFPLILAPLVPPAIAIVTTYSSGTAVIGAGIGGAGLAATGIGGWWWWRTPKDATPSKEHEALLKEQHQMTKERIEEFEEHQIARTKLTDEALTKSTNALATTTKSIEFLDKTVETLTNNTIDLNTTTTTAASAAECFLNALPTLEKSSLTLHEASKKTAEELMALSDRFDSQIAKNTSNAESLMMTIGKQAEDITRLSGEIERLAENNADLKETITLQASEINHLKIEDVRTKQNLRFFKSAAQTLMAQQKWEEPINIPTSI